MSLCSDAARVPFVVVNDELIEVPDEATTDATVVGAPESAVLDTDPGTAGLFEYTFALPMLEDSEIELFDTATEDDDTVELIDNSSCKFFSYSVCFPCCISSFVKLAASSPVNQNKKKLVKLQFLKK